MAASKYLARGDDRLSEMAERTFHNSGGFAAPVSGNSGPNVIHVEVEPTVVSSRSPHESLSAVVSGEVLDTETYNGVRANVMVSGPPNERKFRVLCKCGETITTTKKKAAATWLHDHLRMSRETSII